MSRAALGARLHVLGRLPARFLEAVLAHSHASGARVAWVGGHALPLELERRCDLLCVNAREAAQLVRGGGTPRELAAALAGRATPRDEVRVVTGAGAAASAAALRRGGAVTVVEAAPSPVARERIATLLGVGDAFAAHFLAHSCFQGSRPRARLEAEQALAAAQRAAGRFLIRGRG